MQNFSKRAVEITDYIENNSGKIVLGIVFAGAMTALAGELLKEKSVHPTSGTQPSMPSIDADL